MNSLHCAHDSWRTGSHWLCRPLRKGSSLAPDDGAAPGWRPVTIVTKVCALDAPYMEVVVPHMIRQARYPFAERILVADPRDSFEGKYYSRVGAALCANVRETPKTF